MNQNLCLLPRLLLMELAKIYLSMFEILAITSIAPLLKTGLMGS